MSTEELILLYAILGMVTTLIFIHAAELRNKRLPFQALVPVMALWPLFVIGVALNMFAQNRIRKKITSERAERYKEMKKELDELKRED